MAMTLTIERVMAFMGLDVLVARDEGLFAAEGLDLRIAALPADEDIHSANERASSLEQRVADLEDDLRVTNETLMRLLQKLEERFGEDLDSDGRIG